MAIGNDLKTQYEAVLGDLEHERIEIQRELGGLQKRLRELDNTVITLRRRLDPTYIPAPRVQALPSGVQPSSDAVMPTSQKYALISVRWAILHLLSGTPSGMTTADIAKALESAGVRTKAVNFVNNVSAVLSTTMRARGHEEVESVDGKWRLTEPGRNKIDHIVMTPEFLKRCPWALQANLPAQGAA